LGRPELAGVQQSFQQSVLQDIFAFRRIAHDGPDSSPYALQVRLYQRQE
jgi:hypothetical protein